MLYARQIDPAYQEPPCCYLGWEDSWSDCIITGNRHFRDHIPENLQPVFDRFNGPRLLRALHLVTGKQYGCRLLRGSSYGDWQNLYYPVRDYSPKALNTLEKEYFNLGTEWIVPDGKEEFSTYCYGITPWDIKREIADVTGESPENIRLLFFDGYTKTPKYREV